MTQLANLYGASSPLNTPVACPLWFTGLATTFFDNPKVLEIASRKGITPGQVLLSWGVQRGTIVVPKSENEGRMKSNIDVSSRSELYFRKF